MEKEEELEEGEEKFCPDCGKKLPPDVTYCLTCGILAEIRQTKAETVKSRLLRVGRALVFAAGFVGLISGVMNYGSAWVISSEIANPNTNETTARAYATMALMFLIVGILSWIGSGCGWAAALKRWKRGSLRATVAQIAFLTFIGFLNLIEGIMLWGTTGFGYSAVWATGVLIIILSLPSLTLTAFT